MKQHAWRLGANADWNTHTMLNAVPQRQEFNAGIWLDLEDKTAEWADEFGAVWIIAGPIFGSGASSMLGESHKGEVLAAIPDFLFKIVVRESSNPDRPSVLALKYPQIGEGYGDSPYDHTKYLVSVNRIERDTGLDFFTDLADEDEQSIERRKATKPW